MQKIDNTSIRGGTFDGRIFKAHAISSVCPNCSAKVTFTLEGFSTKGPQNSTSASGICPNCKDAIGFWSMNPSAAASLKDVEIYMYPSVMNYFPTPTEAEIIPDPLRRAFVATIESYNAGIYTAAAVSGRRTLEGIFKFLVPETKRKLPLAKLIDAAMAEKDLTAPLTALSHAIRSGGNLGAHFDMDNEPSEAVARQIVELLSYLISFLYVLPARIEKLENDLKNTPAG